MYPQNWSGWQAFLLRQFFVFDRPARARLFDSVAIVILLKYNRRKFFSGNLKIIFAEGLSGANRLD